MLTCHSVPPHTHTPHEHLELHLMFREHHPHDLCYSTDLCPSELSFANVAVLVCLVEHVKHSHKSMHHESRRLQQGA
eukprot:6216688-Amphidinium_carterae.1